MRLSAHTQVVVFCNSSITNHGAHEFVHIRIQLVNYVYIYLNCIILHNMFMLNDGLQMISCAHFEAPPEINCAFVESIILSIAQTCHELYAKNCIFGQNAYRNNELSWFIYINIIYSVVNTSILFLSISSHCILAAHDFYSKYTRRKTCNLGSLHNVITHHSFYDSCNVLQYDFILYCCTKRNMQ